MPKVQDTTAAHHSALRDAFPLRKIENYIEENKFNYSAVEAAKIQPAITGWATLVAPYTPTFCLELSPQDPILDYVSILLYAMAFNSSEANHDHLHSKILPLWPSIWVWLQILHNDKMHSGSLHGVTDVGPERRQNRYFPIFRIILCFLYIKSQAGLPTAVTHPEDVVTMTASMWIEESKNTSFSFAASGFLAGHKNGGLCPDAVAANILDRIIVGCGSKEDVVELLFHRMKANLNQSKPSLQPLLCDLAFISNQVMNGPSMLQDTFLSNSAHTVVCMVDVLALILRMQSKEPKHQETNPDIMAVIREPLLVVCCVLRNPRAYENIASLLQASFFSLIARAALVCRPIALARKFNESLAQVLMILERFAIHRPLLSAINRGLIAAVATNRVPDGPIGKSLRDFQMKIGYWHKLEQKYHDGWSSLVCGDPECAAFDPRNTLRRCSGCSFVCYCSRFCQRRHWRGEHKKLCRSIRHSDKEPIRFSGPNLRWLGYVISDSAHRLNLQPSVGRPLIVLDYDHDGNKGVGVAVLDLDRTPFTSAYFTSTYSARIPKLEDVWRLCENRLSEPSHHLSRTSTPVLALLPRGWQNDREIKVTQALAAMLIVETSLFGGELVTSRYVKWLHCA